MSNNLQNIRKQLQAGGYTLMRTSKGKVAGYGWNSPERIEQWNGPDADQYWKAPRTIGVIVTGGLLVLDIDVDHERAAQAVLDRIAAIAPDVESWAPTRFGGGEFKVSLFCRLVDGPLERDLKTKDFFDPSSVTLGQPTVTHKVEIFGGARAKHSGKLRRFVGLYGARSVAPDDPTVITSTYTWWDQRPELKDVALDQLPAVTVKQVWQILDAAEYALAGILEQVPSQHPHGTGKYAFFDENEVRFDLPQHGYSQITYQELCEIWLDAKHTGGLRCDTSFIPGRPGHRADQCQIGDENKFRVVGIYVHGDDVTYLPLSSQQPKDTIEQIAKMLNPYPSKGGKGEAPRRPPEPVAADYRDEDELHAARVEWLLSTHGYNDVEDRVIKLWEPSDRCRITWKAMIMSHASWHIDVAGPRGGVKQVPATAGWFTAPSRIRIDGVRMAPGRPFPVFEEGGEVFKNTYRRVSHDGSGDIQPWLTFMEHLLPAEVERSWFLDRLAYKYQHPDVPGIATIMVAADENGPVYGAGRGMLRDILGRLFGEQYVRTLDCDVFTGRSSQGVYTDWLAYSLIVAVNESKDTPDSGRWADRKAVYERMKEIVDPRPAMRTFTVKHSPSFVGFCHATILIFSNNRDALQIPADDRRFTALRNGSKMPHEMAAGLDVWMNQPGNIAALAAWLEARDTSGFNPFDPLHTETKETMQELARSEIDEAFDETRKVIGPRGVFTGKALRDAVMTEVGASYSDRVPPGVEGAIRRLVKVSTARVNGFRMPRNEGRHWLLTWRGVDVSHITDCEVAFKMARSTARRLEKAAGSNSGGAALYLNLEDRTGPDTEDGGDVE